MTSDWHCLDLAREGNESAWQFLYKRYFSYLVRMTSLITNSFDSAQDIAQESMLKLLDCNITHRNGSFKSFLTTIAYHQALKEKHRTHSNNKVEEDEIQDETQSPLETLVQEEEEKMIIRVLQSLSMPHKEILALRFYGGHRYEEIAEITGLPIGTVKSRIFYAMKISREKLEQKGIFK